MEKNIFGEINNSLTSALNTAITSIIEAQVKEKMKKGSFNEARTMVRDFILDFMHSPEFEKKFQQNKPLLFTAADETDIKYLKENLKDYIVNGSDINVDKTGGKASLNINSDVTIDFEHAPITREYNGRTMKKGTKHSRGLYNGLNAGNLVEYTEGMNPNTHIIIFAKKGVDAPVMALELPNNLTLFDIIRSQKAHGWHNTYFAWARAEYKKLTGVSMPDVRYNFIGGQKFSRKLIKKALA